MRLEIVAFATCLLTGPLPAQSFNVNVAGAGSPLPSASFGAAAAQPGAWNLRDRTGGATPLALVDLAGAVTGVTLARTAGSGSAFNFNNPLTSGNDEALLDYAEFPDVTTGSTWTVSGLASGTYQVTTYAWAPDSDLFRTDVRVNGGPATAVGGTWGGTYALGVTHALDTVTVAAGGTIAITLTRSPVPANNFPTFNGFQIRKVTAPTTFCAGDAVGTTCTACGNNGVAGRGCANSTFPAGTRLSTSGVASLGLDTLLLIATDIPGPGLFFQASGLAANPIALGDGMLCAAVGIVRMGIVFPTPTFTATYPGGLTPNPISLAGAPINPGDLKHYQCWYRDAIAFCTPSTFNTTNGVSLIWSP